MMTNLQMLKRWYILKGKVDKRVAKTQQELYVQLMSQRIKLNPIRLP